MTIPQKNDPADRAWSNPNFRQVWSALSVSLVGSHLTALALPLLAVLTLQATPLQMGYLLAAKSLPSLLFSFVAGAWIDRLAQKRHLMIWMDLLRALLLLSLPVAAVTDVLTLPQLYVVAFLLGTCTMLFEIAHYAYVPAILPESQLLDGNSRLQVSYSAASAAGPGLAGLLIQALTAPFALVFDALTYLVSALFLTRIQAENPPPRPPQPFRVVQDVRAGLTALLGHPLLGLWARCGTGIIFFTGAFEGQYVLYLTQALHLSPGWIGAVVTVGGLAGVLGALHTKGVAQRLPVGRTIILGFLVWPLSLVLVPLASGPLAVILGVLMFARVVSSLTLTVSNVQQLSLRQLVTPEHLRARISASNRFLIESTHALGAVFGGALATGVGLRTALLLCAAVAVACFIPLFFSALWKVRRMPTAPAPTV
ncbi:MFS transporter [Deinococcus sp. HMF7604]|uniref:MFS transporter n=1 Tax=Deinococcus betulae TaxID=2873312 RepID=UPI001CCD3311|nr:MFS transporter [Deinococcus betulae]MBZ9753467.1 MFS transporter [Deinococcus betulae]